MQGSPGQSGVVGDPEAVPFSSVHHLLEGGLFLWLSDGFLQSELVWLHAAYVQKYRFVFGVLLHWFQFCLWRLHTPLYT